jgi:hypothetical protein
MIDSNFNLTNTERAAMETARQLLGDNLSDFLLSGLGETQLTHRRAFTAQTISPHVDARTYQFEMVSESKQGLPIGRDLLVLAALLDLLCERQPLDSTILFHESDLLQKLQWSEKIDSKRLVKQALARYALTAYCLLDSTATIGEYSYVRYASIGRLLIGYETTATLLSRKNIEQPPLMRVQFLPALIHDVISERKSFLGIEFQRLGKMVRSTLPRTRTKV